MNETDDKQEYPYLGSGVFSPSPVSSAAKGCVLVWAIAALLFALIGLPLIEMWWLSQVLP